MALTATPWVQCWWKLERWYILVLIVPMGGRLAWIFILFYFFFKGGSECKRDHCLHMHRMHMAAFSQGTHGVKELMWLIILISECINYKNNTKPGVFMQCLNAGCKCSVKQLLIAKLKEKTQFCPERTRRIREGACWCTAWVALWGSGGRALYSLITGWWFDPQPKVDYSV